VATLDFGNGDTPGFRAAVYRVLKAAIVASPAWKSSGAYLSWFDGDPEVISDLDTIGGPALQFLPIAGPSSGQWDESSMRAPLIMQIEGRLTVLDVEDILNMQEALETALDTFIAASTLQADLVAAGASVGLITWTQPLRPTAMKPGADNLFRLTGSFSVEVRRQL
jgi:hypothetical protein